jgi:predicted transcriptional regulator
MLLTQKPLFYAKIDHNVGVGKNAIFRRKLGKIA